MSDAANGTGMPAVLSKDQFTYDILFVADARFDGGSSTAMAVEIKAAARAGLRLALMLVKGPLLRAPFPVHPELAAAMRGGLIDRVDPESEINAQLTLIHHPTIMENRPTSKINVSSKRAVLVLHHPVYDNAGKKQYDLSRVLSNIHDAFNLEIEIAPVSSVVRNSLPSDILRQEVIIAEDWVNLIEIDEWPRRSDRPISTPVIIGRHSRPDKLKWPDTLEIAKLVYPEDKLRFHVRILGAGDYLREHYGEIPPEWELLTFNFTGVSNYLQSLDFYVYFHSSSWSEAYGRTILEALTTGLVVILPPNFEEIFGDAAVYCAPENVVPLIDQYVDDPEGYREQSERARSYAKTVCSADNYATRLERLGLELRPSKSETKPATISVPPPLPTKNVLFVSSNGIGIGHITQQLAISKFLPEDIRPTFATMSYAVNIVAEAGYLVHFIPHHKHMDANPDDWNRVIAEELFDLISHLRPSIFAYDATAVFGGVSSALKHFPNLFSIWVRRPMWREFHRPFLQAANIFDAIIEPGELAAEFDNGPTSEVRDFVYRVPPVLQIEPSERIARERARDILDLPNDLTVVALQLGSGVNFDLSSVRSAVLEALLKRNDTFVLDIVSPLANDEQNELDNHDRYRRVSLFPSFKFSRAFDAAVCVAGYNTFHEQILGMIPTLFIPNEAEEMDVQLTRIKWAELTGKALLLRRDFDLHRTHEIIGQLLDKRRQETMVQSCKSIRWRNGAKEIAQYIEDHSRILRTDWDITKLVY